MRYKLAIFDVDGTLVDTREATAHAARMAYERLTGKAIPEDAWPDVFALSAHDAAVRMGLPDPVAYEHAELECYSQIADAETRLYPGMMDVLEDLHEKGLLFGVCTARVHAEMAFDFDRLGLSRFRWFTACADETGRPKPDPQALLKVLRDARVKDPADAVYLGDLSVDALCSSGAGVPFAQAAWDGQDRMSGVQFYLSEPRQFVDVVLGNRTE